MSGLPLPVLESQLRLARQLAPTYGIEYFFVVTTDEVIGWRLADSKLVFRSTAAEVLKPYADNVEAKVRGARSSYLAALVQAWVADLSSHWKSRNSMAPGEEMMRQSGALDAIQAALPTTTGEP